MVEADGSGGALVGNRGTGERYWATGGGGWWGDDVRISPAECVDVTDSIIGLNGLPPHPLGYRQSRVLGAVALDLCHVAAGAFAGNVDFGDEAHGVWAHAVSAMICRDARAPVVDLLGRELIVLDQAARRTPIAAATPELLAQLVAARRGA